MLDDITEAVLAHEEVAKYLRGGYGASGEQARERVHAYIDELKTTQRYKFYRALQHPLYPILRKIERKPEQLHHVARLEPCDLRLGVDPGDIGVHGRQQQPQRPPAAVLGRVGGGRLGGIRIGGRLGSAVLRHPAIVTALI